MGRTPLRISFFGGGTDLPSFTKKEFGCVINTSIDKHIYLVLHESFDDLHNIAYSRIEHVKKAEDIQNIRVREILKKLDISKGLEIHSIGEVPAGTGLGSSSSFTVGLLNLIYTYKNKISSQKQLAEEASEIEIDILKEPIGKQDQYAAAFGGMNFIKFNTDGSVEIEKLKLSKENIEKINQRTILFYLNKTRSASKILTEQNSNISSNKEKFNIMKKMKKICLKMKEELNNNKIDNFGKMLHQSWLLKKSLASTISNSEIDKIYERGIKAGASGGKILGAGGGGFILFYCEPEKQESLRKELKGLRELKIKFDVGGAKIIYSNNQ